MAHGRVMGEAGVVWLQLSCPMGEQWEKSFRYLWWAAAHGRSMADNQPSMGDTWENS